MYEILLNYSLLNLFSPIIGKSNNKHWPENRLKHDQKSQTRNRNDSSMTSMCKRILTGIIKLTGTMKPSSLLSFLPLSFTMSVNSSATGFLGTYP